MKDPPTPFGNCKKSSQVRLQKFKFTTNNNVALLLFLTLGRLGMFHKKLCASSPDAVFVLFQLILNLNLKMGEYQF